MGVTPRKLWSRPKDNQLTSLPASIGELKALTVNTKGNLADELPYV